MEVMLGVVRNKENTHFIIEPELTKEILKKVLSIEKQITKRTKRILKKIRSGDIEFGVIFYDLEREVVEQDVYVFDEQTQALVLEELLNTINNADGILLSPSMLALISLDGEKGRERKGEGNGRA